MAGGGRDATAAIAMVTGMGVGQVIGQGTGPAVEILVATICIIQNKTRHAPKPNRPEPINARQLPGPPPGGPTTFMLTRTAMSTARQIRDGSSAPTMAGNQKTKRPSPSSNRPNRPRVRCKETSQPRLNSRERSNSRPSSLTAANRQGSRATKEPTVIISPEAAAAAEAVVVEVAVVEVVVVGAVAVAANNLSQ